LDGVKVKTLHDQDARLEQAPMRGLHVRRISTHRPVIHAEERDAALGEILGGVGSDEDVVGSEGLLTSMAPTARARCSERLAEGRHPGFDGRLL
jgi:hypothetical protein